MSCLLPPEPLIAHGVSQVLPSLLKCGVPHRVAMASQKAQDAVNSGEVARARQQVPHIPVVEQHRKNRRDLTSITYKMPGTLFCALYVLFHLLLHKTHEVLYYSYFHLEKEHGSTIPYTKLMQSGLKT